MKAVRDSWRWTPQQDAQLYKRRRSGARLKQLAYEFSRSENVISKRLAMLESLLESEARDVLEMHREEEAALLERLLIEQRKPEMYPEGDG